MGATQDYLRAVVDAAHAVGARVIGGPAYASVGRTWRTTPRERAAAYAELAENLAPVVEHAIAAGVVIGLEPLNRYETSLINTVDQALDAVGRLPAEGIGLMLDVYHMNIEERDLPAAVERAGARIAAVQVCGNDRGAPGGDGIDWPALLAALERAGYDGPLVIESFTGENATIATAASIWRPLAASQDALAIDGPRPPERTDAPGLNRAAERSAPARRAGQRTTRRRGPPAGPARRSAQEATR